MLQSCSNNYIASRVSIPHRMYMRLSSIPLANGTQVENGLGGGANLDQKGHPWSIFQVPLASATQPGMPFILLRKEKQLRLQM